MCGIFGVSFKNRLTFDVSNIIKDLFVLSESRGRDASGFALLQNNRCKILKASETASNFISSPVYQELMGLEETHDGKHYPILIGSTRLATNGTSEKDTNNQPVITNKSVGVHNGMILNEVDIWTKFPNLRREYQVDTEILLKLVEMYIRKGFSFEEAIKRTYKEIKGAASIGMLNTYFSKLVLATNTGSLYYFSLEDFFIFASEKYILSKIVNKYFSHKKNSIITKVLPGYGVTFDYSLFTFSELKLMSAAQKHKKEKSQEFFEIINIGKKQFQTTQNIFKNRTRDLEKHIPDYEKIYSLKRCTKCILPYTMPLIKFDNEGVCNFCRTSKAITYHGFATLERKLKTYKTLNRNNCIVALSGGRDSSFGLHYVKNVLKMNPIAYTYDWGMITDIARRNQYRLTAEMGVEHIIVSADITKKRENIKKNVEAWLHKPNIAMVPLFMAGDKQAEYFAEQVRRQTGIDLIVYCRGNELEDERFKFGYYGIFDGTPGGVLHNLSWMGKVQMAAYYAREYLQNPLYINSSLYDTASAYFSAYLMRHEFLYLWHYIPWNETEIITTLKKNYGWESPDDTIATWRIDDGTPPFYNYIYYTVQGFTEHDGLRSNQIRQGIITRKEALKLVREENKPRYEALKWYFDVTKINGDKALSIVDKMPRMFENRSLD